MLRRLFGCTIISVALISCSRDDTASAHPREASRADGEGVPPRPAVITPSAQPYKVISVAGAGTISGTVDFEGTVPPDPVIRPSSDQGICGNSLIDKRVTHSGSRIAGALVWITDIRSGKALPLERRFELTNDNCTLDPYVQAILTNSTLNVSNDDRALHTDRFINVGTGQIVGIAPFNDDGEVVPVDRFKEPAEIEVVCEQHPWSHAWLAVLDHPYYATTSAAGAFSIDGVPPGRYRVRAWHPSLGFADDSITVASAQQATISFRIKPGAPGARLAHPAAPTAAVAPAASGTPAASSTSASSTSPTASSTPTNIPPPQPPPAPQPRA